MIDIQTLLIELKDLLKQRILLKGGQGSGGWGHDGRLGKHGGSKAGSAGLSKISANKKVPVHVRKLLAKRVSDAKKPGRGARKVREKLATVEKRIVVRNEHKINKLVSEKEVIGDEIDKLFGKQSAIDNLVSMGKLSFDESEKRQDKVIEQIRKQFARRTEINDEISSLSGISRIRKKQRELIYAKEGPANLNIKFKTKFKKGRLGRTQIGIDEFSKMIGKGTVLDDMSIEIKGAGKQRSYHQDGNIALGTQAGSKTVIHELGHVLEFRSREHGRTDKDDVSIHATNFLHERTRGDKARKLNDIKTDEPYLDARRFDDHEIAKPDKFFDPYVGKIYAHGMTEIISMGIEEMWSNPAKFAKEDPEYFDFIYTTLEGARTYQR